MIHYVPLETLPNDLCVPPELEHRFWYEVDKSRLAFDGPMYKATFDKLWALSGDRQYRFAVEELFRRCVPEEPSVSNTSVCRLLIGGLVLAVITVGSVVLLLCL